MFMECGDPTSRRNRIPGYNTYAYIQNTCKCKSNKHDIEVKMHRHVEIWHDSYHGQAFGPKVMFYVVRALQIVFHLNAFDWLFFT